MITRLEGGRRIEHHRLYGSMAILSHAPCPWVPQLPLVRTLRHCAFTAEHAQLSIYPMAEAAVQSGYVLSRRPGRVARCPDPMGCGMRHPPCAGPLWRPSRCELPQTRGQTRGHERLGCHSGLGSPRPGAMPGAMRGRPTWRVP